MSLRKINNVAADIRVQFVQVVIGALTVVAGLAWNNAFLDMFEKVPWMSRFGPFVYAIILTLLVCILLVYLKHVTHAKGDKSENTAPNMMI